MPPSTKALEEKGKILLWPVAATRALALFFIILLSSPLLLPAGFLLFSCPRLFLPFPFLRMLTLAHAKSASRPRRGIVRSSWIWKNTGGHNGVWHTGNRHNRVRPAFNKQLPIYNWWVRLLGPSARPGSREGTGWREWRRERGWMNNADKMPIRAPKRRGPCSANYLPLLMMIVLMQSPNTLPPPCNPSPCLNLTFTQLPLLLPDSPQQRERLNCFYRCTMEDFRSASKRLIKDNTIAFIYFVTLFFHVTQRSGDRITLRGPSVYSVMEMHHMIISLKYISDFVLLPYQSCKSYLFWVWISFPVSTSCSLKPCPSFCFFHLILQGSCWPSLSFWNPNQSGTSPQPLPFTPRSPRLHKVKVCVRVCAVSAPD